MARAITIIICGGCVSLPAMRFHEIYANTSQFAEDTYLARLLAEIMGSTQLLPEDYSVENVELVIDRFREEAGSRLVTVEKDMELPNIIVIMNEAFSDLRILGNLETAAEVLPYRDSVQDNCVRGWANVSILGGNTANSEYEAGVPQFFSMSPCKIMEDTHMRVTTLRLRCSCQGKCGAGFRRRGLR